MVTKYFIKEAQWTQWPLPLASFLSLVAAQLEQLQKLSLAYSSETKIKYIRAFAPDSLKSWLFFSLWITKALADYFKGSPWISFLYQLAYSISFSGKGKTFSSIWEWVFFRWGRRSCNSKNYSSHQRLKGLFWIAFTLAEARALPSTLGVGLASRDLLHCSYFHNLIGSKWVCLDPRKDISNVGKEKTQTYSRSWTSYIPETSTF